MFDKKDLSLSLYTLHTILGTDRESSHISKSYRENLILESNFPLSCICASIADLNFTVDRA